MNYEIILYIGAIGSCFTFILTIYLFIKDNALDNIKDLLGIVDIKNIAMKSSSKNTITSTIKKNNVKQTTYDLKKEAWDNIEKPKSKRRYIENTEIYEDERKLLNDETTMLQDETTMLQDETAMLEYETMILEDETTMLEEEILGENDYIIEKNIMIIGIGENSII